MPIQISSPLFLAVSLASAPQPGSSVQRGVLVAFGTVRPTRMTGRITCSAVTTAAFVPRTWIVTVRQSRYGRWPLVVTYHPSAALRFGPHGAPRAALLADLVEVAALLAEPAVPLDRSW